MTVDDEISDLQAAKLAFAKENNMESCTNDKCGFSGCTCGKRCGCNIPPTSTVVLETCDPCAEFKRKRQAEKKLEAREA
eukprot:CAMPEP_0183719076 /NCGR_PEP_ID=MMETSP0737-20130205/12161_1 /TAXON_ID=385413 /ORGANISM="Thalassiosira miniscula, Strain CCMP1093" /LENGTH=78 /DNA_ID=CAMNT_0025948761 /DNA_START=116 /DNA_END=352 /DNA_ORIENTATION=+